MEPNDKLLRALKDHIRYVRMVLGPYEIAQAMRIPVRRLKEADDLINQLGEQLSNDPASAELRQQVITITQQLATALGQVQSKDIQIEQKNDRIHELEELVEQMKKESK